MYSKLIYSWLKIEYFYIWDRPMILHLGIYIMDYYISLFFFTKTYLIIYSFLIPSKKSPSNLPWNTSLKSISSLYGILSKAVANSSVCCARNKSLINIFSKLFGLFKPVVPDISPEDKLKLRKYSVLRCLACFLPRNM